MNTLFRLYHHGPSPVNDLAEHLGITTAAVSQLLNQLIEAGLILRSINDSDRRVKVIELTEHGTRTVKESIRARHFWVDDLAKTFTSQERDQIYPCLELLNNHTQELFREKEANHWHTKTKKICRK